MWCMVMKLKVMINDGMIGMICLQKVFQSSCAFVRPRLYVMDFYGWDVDGLAFTAAEGESRKPERNIKRREHS